MSGKPGRSGAPKKPSTLVNEALAILDQHLPQIFQVLIQKAEGGDGNCAMYLVDRALGKPKQSVGLDAKLAWGADDILKLIFEARASQQQQLEQPLELKEGVS